jgi:hypothetical protein
MVQLFISPLSKTTGCTNFDLGFLGAEEGRGPKCNPWDLAHSKISKPYYDLMISNNNVGI